MRSDCSKPGPGDLDLPFESLPIEPGSTTSLVTYLPEPDSPSHEALNLLASWAGGRDDQARDGGAHDPASEPNPHAPATRLSFRFA